MCVLNPKDVDRRDGFPSQTFVGTIRRRRRLVRFEQQAIGLLQIDQKCARAIAFEGVASLRSRFGRPEISERVGGPKGSHSQRDLSRCVCPVLSPARGFIADCGAQIVIADVYIHAFPIG